SVVLLGVVYLTYFCPDNFCSLSIGASTPEYSEKFVEKDLIHQVDNFNVEGDQDVIVFLHIQKTGGTTFGRHLVQDIALESPCECYRNKKRCDCLNKKQHMWLFSRYSNGWPCGLHADWTELKNCVSDYIDSHEGPGHRRYLYVTILRDPYLRYLSEWKHVQRGSTWMGARLKCNGREASLEEVPFCFDEEDWSGVTLEEFLACPHNLANNRQTRMLANLSVVSCYNTSAMSSEKRDQLMLQSAKDNLREVTFFGITEFQRDTQRLFESTFHLKFQKEFIQHNATHTSKLNISDSQHSAILAANSLDVQLYAFARELFLQRLSVLNA
ncbi:hypothetical protein CAPTEDRAFT_24524, partial [Capitella teleta]